MFVNRRVGLALVSSLLLSTAVLAQGGGGGVGGGQSGSRSVTQGRTSPTTDSGRSTTTKRGRAHRNNPQNNPNDPNPQSKKLPTAYKVWRISPK
jgi:hypothetical protein